jgi:hypothetical protein
MERNTQGRSAQDNAWTSTDPQITITLLNKKIAQMEKNMEDLAGINAALQAHVPELSHSTTVLPEDEEARNSHIGGRHGEDESLS